MVRALTHFFFFFEMVRALTLSEIWIGKRFDLRFTARQSLLMQRQKRNPFEWEVAPGTERRAWWHVWQRSILKRKGTGAAGVRAGDGGGVGSWDGILDSTGGRLVIVGR